MYAAVDFLHELVYVIDANGAPLDGFADALAAHYGLRAVTSATDSIYINFCMTEAWDTDTAFKRCAPRVANAA